MYHCVFVFLRPVTQGWYHLKADLASKNGAGCLFDSELEHKTMKNINFEQFNVQKTLRNLNRLLKKGWTDYLKKETSPNLASNIKQI